MRQLLRDIVSFHGDHLFAHEDELAGPDLRHTGHTKVSMSVPLGTSA